MPNNVLIENTENDALPFDNNALILLSTATAGIVMVIGLLVLFGWVTDIEMLKRVVPGFTAMNPVTAICLVLVGSTLVLVRQRYLRVSLVISFFIILVALAKGASLISELFPVDLILFTNKLRVGSGPPSVMSPNTMLSLFLAALSLMFAVGHHHKFNLYSQALAALVFGLAVFALVGYAFGLNHANTTSLFVPMALHTAIAFILIAIGLFSLSPNTGIVLVLRDNGPAGSMARTALPLALLVPLGMGTLRLMGQQEGHYGSEVGVTLMTVGNMLVTSIFLILGVLPLHRSDQLRKLREQELNQSEARYRLAEKVAEVGHWRTSKSSQHVTWSEEVYQITGISKENGPPSLQDMMKIYHPDDQASVRKAEWDAVHEGRSWEQVVRLRRPDGAVRHVKTHATCVRDGNGAITGLFGVFADITELENARKKAEEATTAKAAFLANMSHEIRTPLNGVLGFAELLQNSDLTAEQMRHASLIFDSAQSLLKLLNDILDVSKIDAGQLEVVHEPFNLSHQLKQCVTLMTAIAEKKGVALSITVDPALPKTVVGDGLRLRQILLNLLGNAIKFTSVGSVEVRAIYLVSDSGEPMMQIEVEDTGIGISSKAQAVVFNEFVQADDATVRRFGGSGLGLSISRRLTELMGGTINLQSVEGQGTTVMLTFPIATTPSLTEQNIEVTIHTELSPQRKLNSSNRVTVLLAEDLDINQELITAMLDRLGYDVEVAQNGDQAVHFAIRLLEDSGTYGLIFMDMQMPVLDGIAATQAIRAMGGAAAGIPIIALTANAYASDIEACINAGMVDHLSKPVSMAALDALLTRWLRTEPQSVDCAQAADPSELSLTDKFMNLKSTYRNRLAELQNAYAGASAEGREPIIAEVKVIAHNLAGTAATFEEPWLGERAAEIEQILRVSDEYGVTSINDLRAALA